MAFNDNGTIKPVEPKQVKLKDTTSGNPNVVFDVAPVVGNLVLAFLFQDITDDDINTDDWEIFAKVTGSPGVAGTMYGLFRYVQGGDTATLPNLSSVASTGHLRAVAIELRNVCGQWVHDGTSYTDSDFSAKTTAAPAPPINVPRVLSEMQVAILCEMNGRSDGTYTPGTDWMNLLHDTAYTATELSGAVALDFKYFSNFNQIPDPASPSWSAGSLTGLWMVVAIRSDGIARSAGGIPQ